MNTHSNFKNPVAKQKSLSVSIFFLNQPIEKSRTKDVLKRLINKNIYKLYASYLKNRLSNCFSILFSLLKPVLNKKYPLTNQTRTIQVVINTIIYTFHTYF